MKPGLGFYTDAAFIDEACRPLMKNAESALLSSLVSSVQSYAQGKLADHNGDKFATITDFLVPGLMFGFGLRWLALLVKFSESYFGLSPGRILETAWHAIRPEAQAGTLQSSQIDEAVQSAIGGGGTDTAEPPKFGLPSTSSIRAYRLVAMGATQLTIVAAAKSTNASLMGKIISWVLKAALAAAGIEVAGLIFNKLTGHEDAKPTASGWPSFHPGSGGHVQESTQTILKPNPSYVPEHYNQNAIWMESVPASQIGSLIEQWAVQIYPDLQGHEDLITSSPHFHDVVKIVQDYNKANATAYTFVPEGFASKKEVVDYAIDQIAAKYQASQPAPAKPPPDAAKPSVPVNKPA